MIELLDRRTKRGKYYLIETLPDGRKRYASRLSIGALHYKDEAGQWQDIDLLATEPDAEFSFRWTKLPYLVKLANDSRRRIYPDRNDLSYWIEIGKPFANMGSPIREGNKFTWNFTRATVIVIIAWEQVKFGFTLKDNKAPTSITFPFSVQGITRQGSQLLHNGEVVAELKNPIAVDANGIERDVNIAWGSGQVTLSLDATGLAFPIEIDPTFTVGVSSDDIFVYRTTTTWIGGIANERWHVGMWASSEDKCGGGGRFLSINIPQGATIDSAYLQICARSSDATAGIKSRITGEATDNAATFSTIGNYQTRRGTVVGGANDDNITDAQISWDNIASWTAGAWYDSPDIKTIIQEIIDRAGWVSGNALVVFWDDHDGRVTTSAYVRRGRSWNYDSGASAPKLVIEWTEPGGGGVEMLGWII